MPNWCSNWVQFKGPEEVISQIADNLTNARIIEPSRSWWFTFKDFPYTSEEIDKAKKDQRLCDVGAGFFGRLLDFDDLGTKCEKEHFGYNESVANIGTKWDPEYSLEGESAQRTALDLSLQSAWSPPERGVLLVARKYKVDMTMEYEEGGCDFAGLIEYDAELDTVRRGQLSYFAYRFLEAYPRSNNARFDEIIEFLLEELAYSEEGDERVVEEAQEIFEEISHLNNVRDILGPPQPASDWIGDQQAEYAARMAEIEAYVSQLFPERPIEQLTECVQKLDKQDVNT